MKIAGQVETTDDMPGGVHPEAVVRGVDQLQEIQEKLAGQPDRGQEDGWTKVFWKTNSRNCYNFLKQGARWDNIRHEIIQVRWLEKQKKIEVVPVWETKIQKEIVEADRWSKASASTDEWGLQEDERENLWREWAITPTIDAFASSSNGVCPAFYSKWPQMGAAGVNFFAQELKASEVYYCCPPVKEAGHMIGRLTSSNNVTVLVVVHAWEGSVHWSLIQDEMAKSTSFRRTKIWLPTCTDSGRATSRFSDSSIRMWAGLFSKG